MPILFTMKRVCVVGRECLRFSKTSTVFVSFHILTGISETGALLNGPFVGNYV